MTTTSGTQRRDGSSHRAKPQRSFAMRVASVLDVPGRGLSVVGVAERGDGPPVGTVVTLQSPGQSAKRAVIASGPLSETRAPQCGFLLRGATVSDIPLGARISAAG